MTPDEHILDTLHFAQAVLNPLSGFLRKGDKKSQRYIEEVRVKIRVAIAMVKERRSQCVNS